MNTEKILMVILLAIIILPWLFHSDKLGRQLKNQIIIVVDAIALLMYCVAELEISIKIFGIIIFLWMSFLWILSANHGKKEIKVQDLKDSRLDDLCFCLGIGVIVFFLVRMLFGEVDF